MALDLFWKNVNDQLDHIERDKPNTAQGVFDIMNQYHAPVLGKAFFPGSGGDRDLASSLRKAGWVMEQYEAHYYYAMCHPDTNEVITYIEGDVVEGNQIIN